MLATLHGVSLRGRNSASQHCRGREAGLGDRTVHGAPGTHCFAAMHSTGRILSTHSTRRTKTRGCAEDGPHGSRARLGTQLGPRCSVEDTASRLQPRCCILRAAASRLQPQGCSCEAASARSVAAASSMLQPRGCNVEAVASRLQRRGCSLELAASRLQYIPVLHGTCC